MKTLRATVLLLVVLAANVTAQQTSLSGVVGSAAGAWSQKDADGLSRMLSDRGVALYLFDESHPAAGVRQARAALSDVLDRGGRARVSKVEELGGDPQRGMAELSWDVTAPGSPAASRFVIFLGFVLEDGGWRIGEIRVLR